MSADGWRALGPARQRLGLSVRGLHLRYIALSGTATRAELADYLASGTGLAHGERQLVVQTLNERFLELGLTERLPYGPDHAPD